RRRIGGKLFGLVGGFLFVGGCLGRRGVVDQRRPERSSAGHHCHLFKKRSPAEPIMVCHWILLFPYPLSVRLQWPFTALARQAITSQEHVTYDSMTSDHE